MSWVGLPPEEILRRSKTLVVVGCSTQSWKDAHQVPATLQQMGFRIIPVHPGAIDILGEKAYRTVLDVPEPFDTVVVFRPSDECAAVSVAAVDAGAKAVWLQLGLRSRAARRICEDAGVGFVEDACSMVVAREHGIRHDHPPPNRPVTADGRDGEHRG